MHITDADPVHRPPKKDKGKAKEIPAAVAPVPTVEKEPPAIAMPTPKKAAPEPVPEPAPAPAPAQSEAVIASSMPYLVSVPAQLYLWNVEKSFYEQQAEDVEIAARIIQPDKARPYDYWLAAISSDGQFLGHHIDSELNQRYATKALSVTWNHVSDAGRQSSWCFRFLNEEDYNVFVAACTKALWETLNQLPYDKIKVRFE